MAPTIKIRQEWLSQLNALFRAEMPQGKNSLAIAANYHFKNPGKSFRAQLALSSGFALDLDHLDNLHWAAACELLHNASTAKPFSSIRRSHVWRSLVEVAQRVAWSSRRKQAKLLATSFTGVVLSGSPAFAINQQLQVSSAGRRHSIFSQRRSTSAPGARRKGSSLSSSAVPRTSYDISLATAR